MTYRQAIARCMVNYLSYSEAEAAQAVSEDPLPDGISEEDEMPEEALQEIRDGVLHAIGKFVLSQLPEDAEPGPYALVRGDGHIANRIDFRQWLASEGGPQ
jgi:hypothetical protein